MPWLEYPNVPTSELFFTPEKLVTVFLKPAFKIFLRVRDGDNESEESSSMTWRIYAQLNRSDEYEEGVTSSRRGKEEPERRQEMLVA